MQSGAVPGLECDIAADIRDEPPRRVLRTVLAFSCFHRLLRRKRSSAVLHVVDHFDKRATNVRTPLVHGRIRQRRKQQARALAVAATTLLVSLPHVDLHGLRGGRRDCVVCRLRSLCVRVDCALPIVRGSDDFVRELQHSSALPAALARATCQQPHVRHFCKSLLYLHTHTHTNISFPNISMFDFFDRLQHRDIRIKSFILESFWAPLLFGSRISTLSHSG